MRILAAIGQITSRKKLMRAKGVLWMFRSSSALAQLYGTDATLEHHHFNHAVVILNSEV